MGRFKHCSILDCRRIVFALIFIVMLGACGSKAEFKPQKPSKAEDQEEVYRKYNVERGKRLVELGGCSQCHTPKIKTTFGYKPDKDRFLSGYPSNEPLPELPYAEIIAGEAEKSFYTTDATVWVGRWGVGFATNLTPDPETGIGAWEEQDFIDIFRGNKHFADGDQVTSPMPVRAYSQLSYFELKSIFVYLQTIEPISNEVPKRIPPESDLFEGSDI
jgi:hypothetical protein